MLLYNLTTGAIPYVVIHCDSGVTQDNDSALHLEVPCHLSHIRFVVRCQWPTEYDTRRTTKTTTTINSFRDNCFSIGRADYVAEIKWRNRMTFNAWNGRNNRPLFSWFQASRRLTPCGCNWRLSYSCEICTQATAEIHMSRKKSVASLSPRNNYMELCNYPHGHIALVKVETNRGCARKTSQRCRFDNDVCRPDNKPAVSSGNVPKNRRRDAKRRTTLTGQVARAIAGRDTNCGLSDASLWWYLSTNHLHKSVNATSDCHRNAHRYGRLADSRLSCDYIVLCNPVFTAFVDLYNQIDIVNLAGRRVG